MPVAAYRYHPFSMYAKFSEKLTFLTPWFFWTILHMTWIDNPAVISRSCSVLMDELDSQWNLLKVFLKAGNFNGLDNFNNIGYQTWLCYVGLIEMTISTWSDWVFLNTHVIKENEKKTSLWLILLHCTSPWQSGSDFHRL